jgi:hypothetical protein
MSNAALAKALALSEAMLAAAEAGDFQKVKELDAQRLDLLRSFRREVARIEAADRDLLAQVGRLNDRTIGLVEHHQRRKGREMDIAAVGRRAVAAYAGGRQAR